jgi:hypothetical protein
MKNKEIASSVGQGTEKDVEQKTSGGMNDVRPSYFLTAFFIAFAIFLGCMWYISAFKKPLFAGYPLWLAKEQMVDECDVGDLTIIGDSRAVAGIIPTQLGKNVVNLALGGGSPIEAYFMAKKVLACPKRPSAFLVSLSPEHFHAPESGAFWDYGAMSGLYDFRDLEEVRVVSRKFKDGDLYDAPKIFDIEARLKDLLYSISFPGFNFQSIWSNVYSSRARENSVEIRNTKKSHGQRYFGMSHRVDMPNNYAKESGLVRDPVTNYFFAKMLHLMKDAGIPVYFVNLPYHEYQRPAKGGDLAASFITYLDAFERQGLLKVVGDPFPFYPAQFFGDEAHLNPLGALRFSRSLCRAMPASLHDDNVIYETCASGHGIGTLPPDYYLSNMHDWDDVAATQGQ